MAWISLFIGLLSLLFWLYWEKCKRGNSGTNGRGQRVRVRNSGARISITIKYFCLVRKRYVSWQRRNDETKDAKHELASYYICTDERERKLMAQHVTDQRAKRRDQLNYLWSHGGELYSKNYILYTVYNILIRESTKNGFAGPSKRS